MLFIDIFYNSEKKIDIFQNMKGNIQLRGAFFKKFVGIGGGFGTIHREVRK